MIGEGLHAGRELLSFSMSPVVNISDGHKLDVRQLQRIAHIFLASGAKTDCAEAYAIAGAEHAAARQDRCDRRTRRRSFEKFSPSDVLAYHHYMSSMTIQKF